jgi:putative transposase
MLKTYKYRLYPDKKQIERLDATLNACRFLYNSALEERKEAWQRQKVSLSYRYQANELVECKEAFPELNEVHSQVLQDTLRRLDKAFQNFFRRVKNGEKPGYPRFKGSNQYNSFVYPQSGFKLRNGKLYLSKIGDIRIKLHRPIEGNIKTLTIIRKIEQWYACFAVKVIRVPIPKPIKSIVGIDMGLNSFAILSTGEQMANPRWLKKSEKTLARRQRLLSKKARGSCNRRKQRILVAKLHRRVANQRRDFHHKISRWLVDTYDFIAYEDLNVEGMVRNHHLAKSISDAGWSQFIAFVCYKAAEAGGVTMAVNPSGTSVDCSNCGFPVSKSLAQRMHKCPNCGLEIDRDWNAARNILALALPQGLREVKPVETRPLPFQRQAWSVKQEATGFNRW